MASKGEVVMAPDLDPLARLVATTQDHLLAERESERGGVSERLVALRTARMKRARERARVLRGGAVLFVAAAAALLFVVRRPKSEMLSFEVGTEPGEVGAFVAPVAASSALRFSDGSQIDVAPASAVRVAGLATGGADVVLERGHAHTHVVPREGNHWSIVAGPYRVQVKGTRFDTSWNPSTNVLEVTMQEGHVLVTGGCLGPGRELWAGDTAEVSCSDDASKVQISHATSAPPRTADPVAAPVVTAPSSSATEPEEARRPTPVASTTSAGSPSVVATASSARAEPSPPAAPASPTWAELALGGRHREAIAIAPVDVILAGGSKDTIMSLADTARHGGRSDIAERAYRAVRARFPGGEEAARATFLLGRLMADSGRSTEAEALFLDYGRLAPNGVFAEEALGRLLSLAKDHLDDALARERARSYLQRFPRGAAADHARALLLP